jgi:hypothetical protein
MRIETRTFTVDYKVFDVGEHVKELREAIAVLEEI